MELTWDETDPQRGEISQKIAAGTADDDDIHAYLASSSGEDEEEKPMEGERRTGGVERPVYGYVEFWGAWLLVCGQRLLGFLIFVKIIIY